MKKRLIQGDCLEVMKDIESGSIDLIIADPPYYKTINEQWDKQWKTEGEYLAWCAVWFAQCVRLLKVTGSFYCFGNFDILSKQKALLFDNSLKLRQNITLDKGVKSIAGRTSDKLRMFPTASEYLLFYTNKSPFSEYLHKEMISRGLKEGDFRKLKRSKAGNPTGWCSNIIKGKNIPVEEEWELCCELITPIPYDKLNPVFNLPFGVTDVWDFTPDKVRYGHPTQKPQDICRRIVEASSNVGHKVLVPFAGVGSELLACKNLGRDFIGIELDKKYFEIAKNRINNTPRRLF